MKKSETEIAKKRRGRPRKIRTPEELQKLEEKQKNKMSLAEKQEQKLIKQQQKQKTKGNIEPANKDRFYCKNKDLHLELLKWRNSAPANKSFRVKKLIKSKLVDTEITDTPEQHEKYQDGIKYFVEYPKTTEWMLKRKRSNPINIYKETNTTIIENVTMEIEHNGWAFDYSRPEDRVITDNLGKMMIHLAEKLLNHSSFRNYKPELKEDMRAQFYIKIIKGLKTYNFKFNNPFSFFTTAAYNAYLIVLNQYYKHENFKHTLMTKLLTNLQTYNGISTTSGLAKSIKTYIDNYYDTNQ